MDTIVRIPSQSNLSISQNEIVEQNAVLIENNLNNDHSLQSNLNKKNSSPTSVNSQSSSSQREYSKGEQTAIPRSQSQLELLASGKIPASIGQGPNNKIKENQYLNNTGDNKEISQLVKTLNSSPSTENFNDQDARIYRVDSSSEAFNLDSGETDKKKIISGGKMKLYILIDGISPFVLRLNILKNHHYLQIATQYYSELYDGKPPGPIFLIKAIHFANGDKWLYFKRRATLQVKFQFEVQLRTPIYEELQACNESVQMGKNPSKYHIQSEEVIRLASLNRLMLIVTDPWAPKYYMNVIWYTFDTFMDPKILLMKLIERWFVPDLLKDQYNYSIQQELFYTTIIKNRVKHRVASLILEFVTDHFWRFSEEMITVLKNFLDEHLKLVYPVLSHQILQKIQSEDKRSPWELYTPISISSNQTKSKSSTILNISVQELAEQLTLLDMRLYKKIHFTEMCNQAWSKAKHKHKAPYLLDHINILNHVSNWVSYLIVSEQNQNNRKNLLKKFIKTAEHLMEIRSYNMMMAIDSGLSSGPVYRLTMTWDEMDEKVMQKREPIADLTSTSDNYKKFRAAMQQAYERGEPCVPYSGIYLRDLVFTDDGNPAFIDGKINFNKCIQTYNIIDLVLRFQKREFTFTENVMIQSEIYNHQDYSKDELYEMSISIQGRGQR